MEFTNLRLDSLLKDYQEVDYSHQISIHPYYSEFIEFFKSKDVLVYNDIIVATHMVYGWMPTMLRINTKEIDQVLVLLNKVKKGHSASLEELGLLRAMINNSMVGPSKLLHFISPEKYAIWDSRIFRYITGKVNQSQISKAINYFGYLEGINSLVNQPGFLRIHEYVQSEMNVEYSKLRTAEIVMFETDKINGKRIT